MMLLALILFWALILLALSSCATTRTIVKEGAVRTEWRDRLAERRDSIYVHDSVYLHSRGDTVYLERWRTRFRDRLQRDTVYMHKVDSVYVDTQVKKMGILGDAGYSIRLLVLGSLIAVALYFYARFRRRWR